jgi:protein-tyrosine phosphatase
MTSKTEGDVEQERSRRLMWEGCYNARDLGGYPTRDGRETRWGAIARSDTPWRLTAAGRESLVAHGVRTIVDLRLPKELATHPNPFAEPGDHGIAYVNLSLLELRDDRPSTFATAADDYKDLLERFRGRVAAILRAIADAPPGVVLVHCAAGKDRTGLVSALLLDLAGVPRETIAEDYALSSEYLRPYDEEWLANGPGERAEREAAYAKYYARAEVMLDVLAYLDERYGSPEAYLLQVGVAPEEIARLRTRLLPGIGESSG